MIRIARPTSPAATTRTGSARATAALTGARQLVVEHDFQGRAGVLELHDGGDEDHVGQLLDGVTRAIERDRTTLVFDLANVTDLDSAVLRFLADVQTVADRSGWTILFVLPALSSVRGSLAAAGLARRRATYGSLAAALLAISGGTQRALPKPRLLGRVSARLAAMTTAGVPR